MGWIYGGRSTRFAKWWARNVRASRRELSEGGSFGTWVHGTLRENDLCRSFTNGAHWNIVRRMLVWKKRGLGSELHKGEGEHARNYEWWIMSYELCGLVSWNELWARIPQPEATRRRALILSGGATTGSATYRMVVPGEVVSHDWETHGAWWGKQVKWIRLDTAVWGSGKCKYPSAPLRGLARALYMLAFMFCE